MFSACKNVTKYYNIIILIYLLIDGLLTRTFDNDGEATCCSPYDLFFRLDRFMFLFFILCL